MADGHGGVVASVTEASGGVADGGGGVRVAGGGLGDCAADQGEGDLRREGGSILDHKSIN